MEQKEGYIQVKGGRVWYQISGEGTGLPLLFLHGGPGFPPYSFECLKEIENQRPIIFYHQLGAGKSDRPDDISLWIFDRFIDELETVVKELKLNKFHLLGHSWGGALALGYTLKHQDKVKSLLLLSPFLSTKKWLADANRLKKNLPKEMQIIIYNNEKNGTTDSRDYKKAEEEFSKRHWCRLSPLPESILKGIREGNSKIYQTMWGPSEFHCTGNLKNLDLTLRLPELKMPVLFACGRYDEATPETISEFQKLVPNSKMIIFENSAHRAEAEEKEKFVSTTKEFLNGVNL